MKTLKLNEKGQILILFVFGLIGLLAFTALALDGGMVFADRRYDQSVADAAALAGARAAEAALNAPGGGADPVLYSDFSCNPSDPKYPAVAAAMTAAIDAAIARANANLPVNDTFVDIFDTDLSDDMGVAILCHPDPTEPPSLPEDRYLDVQVKVASESRTSFAHLLFGRTRIRNEVISVVRLKAAVPFAYGNAIVSLNDMCSGNESMIFDGGGNNDTSVVIDGGGVFSNSCIYRNGKFSVEVEDGSVALYSPLPGGYQDNGTGTIDPYPVQATEPIVIDKTWSPTCGDVKRVSDATVIGTVNHLSPGKYVDGISINGGDWVLEEGLYCIEGTLKINGGNVTGGCTEEEFTNNQPGPSMNADCDSGGVTFYILPNTTNSQPGNVTINGGAIVEFYAPLDPQAKPEINGMLFYMPAPQDGIIEIEGNSESVFRGTIFAPKGDIKLTGTQEASADFGVQVVGWNVTIGGTASLDITYDTDSTVVFPAAASQHN